MNLYNLNDDGNGDLGGDETTWRAIWAPDLATADAMFREWYERETGCKPGEYEVGGGVCSESTAAIVARFAPAKHGHERRDEVLRLVGWRNEDDHTCESCGLAEMGQEDGPFHVCRECEQCGECGHDDDCPVAADPAIT